MTDEQLKTIKDSSNKDLRCAITMLQFQAAGKYINTTKDDYKDFGLSIFHALGKFLNNKRFKGLN